MTSYADWHSTAQGSGAAGLAAITDATSPTDPSGTDCDSTYWEARAYDQIRAIILELGSSPGSGSTGNWIINSDNATADTEDSYLYFERGTTTPNAGMYWDSSETAFHLTHDIITDGDVGQTGTRVEKKD